MGGWPVVDGRYEIGNSESCVAVMTNASIDEIKLDMAKVAIMGKCVTENIGMEKIIENTIANPNIRFLISCGKPSKGHFPGECFEALVKNGIDGEKKIIGAPGNMPYLKNLDSEKIERFRNQVSVVNLGNEKDSAKIMDAVNMCIRRSPGKFEGDVLKVEKAEEIEAEKNKGFVEDPHGYFLINLDKSNKRIVVEHVKEGKTALKIVGKDNEAIRDTIARLKLIKPEFTQSIEHAIYLGRELYKAELALKNDLSYEQDSELEVQKKGGKQEKKEVKPEEDYSWHD